MTDLSKEQQALEAVTLRDFTEAVFDATEGGGIYGRERCRLVLATQAKGSTPVPGKAPHEIENGLGRVAENEVAYYVGTSAVYPNEDGEVRNRRAAFAGLYAVVLDDVGTKVLWSDLPDPLQTPTWAVESSEGNYQLGYALEDPVMDYEVAKTLLDQVVAGAGADKGGCMPCKLVRLPFGFHAKSGRPSWAVRLVEWNPTLLFDADDLLAAVGSTLTMAMLTSDLRGAVARDSRHVAGTAPFRDVSYHVCGVVDEVAEWLVAERLVLEDGDGWWKIRCPWSDEHTDVRDVAAGYCPLGASGSSSPASMRSFKCFHSHEHNTKDFLRWVQQQGGPVAPVTDLAAPELARWVLDMQSNSWVDIERMAVIPDSGFRTGHGEIMQIPTWTPAGKPTMARKSVYAAMVESSGLVRVMGRRFEPGAPVVMTVGGGRYVNDCQLPVWPMVDWSGGDSVDRIVDFLKYLMPDWWEWFVQHLAMKAQNPKYRGNTVFLHTPVGGTGRGTLVRLLGELWGWSNVRSPKWREFVSGVSGGFNAGLRGLWCCVAEIPSRPLGEGRFEVSTEVNNLKEITDPGVIDMEFNEKYGAKWRERYYASVLLCANDPNALAAVGSDRRIARIECTTSPRSVEWFGEFIAWMESSDAWKAEVWSWLQGMDVSAFEPVQNLALTSEQLVDMGYEDEGDAGSDGSLVGDGDGDGGGEVERSALVAVTEATMERWQTATEQAQVFDLVADLARVYVMRHHRGFVEPLRLAKEMRPLLLNLSLSRRQQEHSQTLLDRAVKQGLQTVKVDGKRVLVWLDGKAVAVRGCAGWNQRVDELLQNMSWDSKAVKKLLGESIRGVNYAEMRSEIKARIEELRPDLVL